MPCTGRFTSGASLAGFAPVKAIVSPHVITMPTFAEELVKLVNESPGMTDRELTNILKGKASHPSQVNQEARHLERKGLLVRRPRTDGFIGNYPSAPKEAESSTSERPAIVRTPEGMSEDEN